MAELRRIDKKKAFLNFAIVLALAIVVLLLSYGCHVVDLLSPVAPSMDEFAGRMYGNIDKNCYLLIEDDATITLSEDGVECTIPTSEYEYVDGILFFELQELQELPSETDSSEVAQEKTTYTFVLVEGDRLFFKEKNVYMELVWISV